MSATSLSSWQVGKARSGEVLAASPRGAPATVCSPPPTCSSPVPGPRGDACSRLTGQLITPNVGLILGPNLTAQAAGSGEDPGRSHRQKARAMGPWI